MSSKVRVYEVARDLGMDNKALVALFQSVGVSEVRNHMSAVAPEAVERVKRHLEKQNAQKVVEERIRPTVVKRRAIKKPRQQPSPRRRRNRAVAKPVAPSALRRGPPDPLRPRSAPPQKPAARGRAAPSAAPAEAKPAAAAPAAAEPAAPAPAQAEQKPAPAEVKPAEVAAAPAPPHACSRSEEAKPPARQQPRRSPPRPRCGSRARPQAEKPEPAPQPAPRPSSPPKTGIEVWEGRPGVPMPQQPRGGPTPRRVQYDAKAPRRQWSAAIVGGPGAWGADAPPRHRFAIAPKRQRQPGHPGALGTQEGRQDRGDDRAAVARRQDRRQGRPRC